MRLLDKLGGSRGAAGRPVGGGRRTSDRLRGVLDAAGLLAAPSMEALLDRVGEAAQSLLGASHARVHLYDSGTGELWSPSPAGRLRVPAGEGPLGQALRTGHAVRGPGGPGHLVCAPLRDVNGRVIGMLEVGQPASAPFDPTALQAASLLAQQAAFAVQRFVLRAAAAQGESFRRERKLAQEVQAALLPGQTAVPGVEAFGWTRPASIAGGDCFDYWRLPDGRLALFLGDASGHGLAGAMVIAQVRALLHVLSDVNADPAWLLARVNARMHEDLEPSRFVTAFLGCLAPDGRLDWCSAGQGPVYARVAADGEFQALDAHVPPLGVYPDIEIPCPPPLHLARGGRVAVPSDGILEADNGCGLRLGPRRVKTVLDNTSSLPPAKVVELVRDVLFTWQGGHDAADDQSILIAGLA
jgi:serine phosphatase RsbU (regulator of sigma subunit)